MKPVVYLGALGAVTAGLGLALHQVQSERNDLSAEVARLSRQNAELRYEVKVATRRAGEVQREAVELDTQLGSTKRKSSAIEATNSQLVRTLSEREQREVALMAELGALRQNPLPSGTGLAQEATRRAELEQQLVSLLTRALAETSPISTSHEEPPAAHQVVRVGPADAFVVLDYGSQHGATPGSIIRVTRGTTELAEVQISETRPAFSIAQVLPASVKGKLQSGDIIVFTP